MRIVISPQPQIAYLEPAPAGVHLIRQPKKENGLIFSILVGLIIPVGPTVLLGVQSALIPGASTYQGETVPWWIVFPVLIVCVTVHEFLHLMWHPGWGLTRQSSLIIWPRKIQFGVYYDGYMTRRRWLVMRLSPLVGLTVLPTLFLLVAHFYGIGFFWQQFITLVILVNGLGSGGDLLASAIVFRQVPVGGEIGISNGRACWR